MGDHLYQPGLLPGYGHHVRADGSRIGGDRYYTPAALAEALVLDIKHRLVGQTILEPHCGGGAFVRALQGVRDARVLVNDCDPAAPALPPGQRPMDFLMWRTPVDWVVGNCPYNEAERHVRHALSIARYGVAFLLRLAFCESQERIGFWQSPDGRRLLSVNVLAERPSFTGGDTDSCAYGWFVWGPKGHTPDAASVRPCWSWRTP